MIVEGTALVTLIFLIGHRDYSRRPLTHRATEQMLCKACTLPPWWAAGPAEG
jgi:hypothetical protein